MLLIKLQNIASRKISVFILGLVGCSTGFNTFAATTFFEPVADASLLEVAEENSLGGFIGMNSGTTLNYKTRALMRFDLTSLPTSTLIQSAALHIDVTRQPIQPSNVTPTFGLRRMLRPWGEGTNSPNTWFGLGLPAIEGDATWLHAYFPTNFWSSPGGAAGVDFSNVESTFTDIYDVNSYTFASTPETVDDITEWITNPQTNFGWLLLCNNEGATYTARRFGTREDFGNSPRLELQFLVPPQLTVTRTNTAQVAIHFSAWAGHTYHIEYRNSVSTGTWQLLSQIPAATTNYSVVVIDTASVTQRFYRVNAY